MGRKVTFDDRGDIILGWFTRVATFLLLLGIVAFECISLVTARFNGEDIAGTVATAAAEAYGPRRDARAAYAAAEDSALAQSAELDPDSFTISPEGVVDLKVTTTATTLFLYRTESTAKWAVVTSGGRAQRPTG